MMTVREILMEWLNNPADPDDVEARLWKLESLFTRLLEAIDMQEATQ